MIPLMKGFFFHSCVTAMAPISDFTMLVAEGNEGWEKEGVLRTPI
jgi:hypothetical protein